ncbi:MAG: nucleotidyltransferase domain-containing protein [Methanobacteriaceae archaeon]|nr:nucleotidyltransferase domain-containing protein [Methanobacteriaceae archaeon]
MINKVLQIIKERKDFDKVKFIILYGSVAQGKDREDSDIDLCVYYEGSRLDASRFRLETLSEILSDEIDLQIYQQLPLYIRKDVLKGELLYSQDNHFLHDVACQTIKEFEDFKRHYYHYIGEEFIT